MGNTCTSKCCVKELPTTKSTDTVNTDVQDEHSYTKKSSDKQSCSSLIELEEVKREVQVDKVPIELQSTEQQHGITPSCSSDQDTVNRQNITAEQHQCIATSCSLSLEAVQIELNTPDQQHSITPSCSLGEDGIPRQTLVTDQQHCISSSCSLDVDHEISEDKTDNLRVESHKHRKVDGWQEFEDFTNRVELQLDAAILDELISQCAIIVSDREEIEKPPSQKKRNDVLTKILKERSFPTFSLFTDILAKAEKNNPAVQKFVLTYQQSKRPTIGNIDKTKLSSQNVSIVADELAMLHKNYRTIVEGLDKYTTENIVDHLFSDDVINMEDKEKISFSSTTHQMNRCLLSVVTRKGTEAIRSLFQKIKEMGVEMQNTEVTEQDKTRVCNGQEKYKQRQSQDHIPEHMREKFRRRVNDWIADDKMFVPTQAAEEVMAKIKECSFVVATGNSGTGKTYTVRHTALMMEKEGYTIVPAEDPKDIKDYFKHGCKIIFVCDDICGRFTLNQNLLEHWMLYKESLVNSMEGGCCKIIASCRLQVFNDEQMKVFISDIGGNECKIISSVKEKKTLIKKYFGDDGILIAETKLSEFDFLPFLCSNLKNKYKNISELGKCFESPFKFFSDAFKEDGKRKYCALILCVLYNNTLNCNDLNSKIEVLHSVLEDCELSSTESPKRIKTSLESLIGVYITYEVDTYKIIHDKLFDYISKYFGEKTKDLFIKFAISDFVKERFIVGSSKNTDCIEISKDKLDLFMQRLVSVWENDGVKDVFRNTNMKSGHFCQRFLTYLKKLDIPFQRELIQKRDKSSGYTPLYMICFYGDPKFARWMLYLEADVGIHQYDKYSPLQIACQEGYTDLVKILLKYQQVVNHADDFHNDDKTALHLACVNGHSEIVTELTQRKVDVNKVTVVNICNETNYTPLMLACKNNHLKVVKVLLKCEQINVHHSTNDGQTVLHFACRTGNADIVTELIKGHVDINSSDRDSWTPLKLACYYNHLQAVKVLLKCEQIDVDHSEKNGQTALHLACKAGHSEIVTEFIQRHADVNRIRKGGWTPLMLACRNNHLEVVKVLLKCEEIDVHQSDKYGLTVLHFACREGNLDIVTELIQRNVHINRIKKNGWTPLMSALFWNRHKIVKMLLMCEQIEVHHTDAFGETALHLACEKGNEEIVTELTKRNLDINKIKNNGRTPLMLACYNNNVEVVYVLLKCEQINVNHSDKNGQTALHLACMEGNLEIVTELIKGHVDINIRDEDGWTPLMLAFNNNHLGVVKVLMHCEQIDIHHRAHDGQTAVHLACREGNEKFVTEMIQRNADINSSSDDGLTPLLKACYYSHLEVVKVLLKCKQININHNDDDGQTALHLACASGNEEIVTRLIQLNVDINMSKKDGRTPLMLACTNSHLEVVKVLLKCQQINVHLGDINGKTALHVACEKGNIEIVTELIKYNADINSCKKDDWTPLMSALFWNHFKIVKMLLKCEQIDVHHSANDGQTALHLACNKGNVKIVTQLVQRKVDINKSKVDGWTPLMVACDNNYAKVVKVLLKCDQIDIDCCNDQGCTALYIACQKGNINIIKLLINHMFIFIEKL